MHQKPETEKKPKAKSKAAVYDRLKYHRAWLQASRRRSPESPGQTLVLTLHGNSTVTSGQIWDSTPANG
jgi:hypothetical protein